MNDINSLYNAVQKEDLNAVLEILEENDDLDKLDKGKALLLACKGNILTNVEIAKVLIVAEADVNVTDTNFVTPLIAVCKKPITVDFIEVINMIIESGADINAQEEIYVYKYSSLYHAVQNENFQLVELLLKAGANVNIADKDLVTPLLAATKKNNFDIAALLIHFGANVNSQEVDCKASLHYSVQKRNFKLTDLLIKSGADVNVMDYESITPLFSLYQSTDPCTKLAKMLIKSGARVDDFCNRNALHYAANGGNIDLAKLFIRSRSKVNMRCYRKKWTPLHYAAENANLQFTKILLKAKADVNIVDKDQCTPLIILSRSHQYPYKADTYVNLAKLLIKAGANINAANSRNCSALFYAAKKGNLQLINLLIKTGANANVKSNDNRYPLMLLSKFSFDKVPEWFEKLVSDTKSLNLATSTILIDMAGQTGNKDILKILLKNGANVNFCSEGRMVLDSLLSSFNVTVDLFIFLWGLTDKRIFKETHDVSKFLIDMIRNKWYKSDKILCVFCVIDVIDNLTNTPPILYEIALNEFHVQDNYEIYSDFEYYNYEEYRDDVIFHAEDLYIDSNFLNIDIWGIVERLLNKGANFDDNKNLEGVIYLCYKYGVLENVEKGIQLIEYLVEKNVNFNNKHILAFTVVNYPTLSPTLLKYCIECNPIDIFQCICETTRRDTLLLNLIKIILTLCTPSEELRIQCMTHLKNVKISYRYVGQYDCPHEPMFPCVKICESEEEKEQEQILLNMVINMLKIHRVPTLQEICRDKVRKVLRQNCCNSSLYLKNLNSIYLPKLIQNIIQCQYPTCDICDN